MTQHESHSADPSSAQCAECGFGLWLPIMRMTESEIGLYSDARFPGRCIVTMRDHFDHLSEVPPLQLMTFMEEVQYCVDAIKRATSSERVNVAILGNAESHVHAHLIPRNPRHEPLPNKAPWEDPRPKGKLSASTEEHLMNAIRDGLEPWAELSHRKPVNFVGKRRQKPTSAVTPDVPLFDMMSDDEAIR